MKICTKCHKLKPFEDFNKDRTNPTGYKSRCRECAKQDRQTDEFREKGRKQVAKWRQTEKGKEYTRQYEISEKSRARKKAWKKTEAGKESERKYYRSEKALLNAKQRRENNPKEKEYQKRGDKRYRTNPKNRDKISARKAVWYAVKIGKLPHVTTLQCSYCSNQATNYHHHNGYTKEHKLDVVPACRMCHENQHIKPLRQS